MMKKYLDKHMKRCLSKEERDAMFKEHPKPDLQSCNPPKVDKYISEFLGETLTQGAGVRIVQDSISNTSWGTPSHISMAAIALQWAMDTLFGEEFQASLTTRVEKDNALSKAVSITKRNKKHEAPSSSRKEGQRNDRFFRGGPPAKYRGRQGKSFFPYNSHFPQKKEGESSRGTSFPNYHRPGYRPLYHEPRLPQDQFKKVQQRKQ